MAGRLERAWSAFTLDGLLLSGRHTSDLAGRASLASRNHDEQLHDGVVDLGAAGLNDEDILLADAGEDPDARLSVGELGELSISWRHTQVFAYFAGEGRARAARKDEGAAHCEKKSVGEFGEEKFGSGI